MTRIQYRLEAFNAEQAKAYALVAMVTEATVASTLYNINRDGSVNANFKGAGIAKANSSGSNFTFYVDGESYLFNNRGASISMESSGLKLMLAYVIEDINPSGNAATGTNTGSTEKDENGNIINKGITYGEKTIVIDSMNARDQFATEILNSILQKIDVDPAYLSNSARSHYCQVAYDWAANMMTASANARGTFRDKTETKDSAKQEAVGDLSNTTDKLLNNMIVALERNDIKTTVDGVDVYSQRMTLDNMNTLVNKITEVNTVVTALKDNITNAMTNMQSVQTQMIGCLNNIVSQLALINTSIQGFTSNMNTRMNAINSNVSSARNEISDIQDDVNTANTNINSIKTTVNTVNTNLNTVKSDVGIIKQNTTP